MHRTKRSILNVAVMFATNVIILGTAFLVQRVFISSLGSDYNGINGLFTSIISMMSLTDLGIGSAIIYHLYKPAAESDYKTINALLRFYKTSYIIISAVVLLIGIIIMIFLPYFIGTVKINDNLYLIFFLFLADCLVSYFLSYKKSLLYAYQMNYILDGTHFVFYMIQNGAQLFVLYYFNSYVLFLIIKTLSKYIENITISFYIKKRYPFTVKKQVNTLDKTIKEDIIIKVKALLFHRLGKLIITGSDSLVITGVLGITQMSLFTNYQLIIGGITALLNKIFETLTSSVGNFLLDSKKETRYVIYRNIDFLNFWVFGCAAVVLYTGIQPLMILWVGEKYLFSKGVLFWLLIKFYQEGMRASVITFKDAAGIYYQDRYIPIIESLINIIVSLCLAWKMGIKGVFLGTVISSIVVYFYSFPKYVCKPLFQMNWNQYVWKTIQHLFVVIGCMHLAQFGCNQIVGKNLMWNMILSSILSVFIFHFFLFAIYFHSKEMKYFINLVTKFFRKREEIENV